MGVGIRRVFAEPSVKKIELVSYFAISCSGLGQNKRMPQIV